jgi:hypothetical protein
MTKFVIENGMRVVLPEDATLSDLKKAAPKGRESDEVMIEDVDGMLRPIQEGEQLPNGAKIFRVPEIEKGSSSRIEQEVNILRDQIKGRGREVRVGKKSLSGRTYTGLIVKNFRLNPSKYEDTKTDVYVAVSKDGGASFKEYKLTKKPFTPSETIFFGDYLNIAAVNGVVRPIWPRMDNGKISLWVTLFDLRH